MYLRKRASTAALILLIFSLAQLRSPARVDAQLERSVLISEFLADNEEGLQDSRGERHDWVELHNPGTIPVDLRGYFLTDTPEELDRWRFPELIIPPRGYAVVFAAGVEPDELEAETRLHTSFRLRSGGEYLALVAPDGVTVLSEFSPEYPRQFEDVSYGQDALGREGYYIEPTPGEPNGDGVIGFLDSPAFSVERGCYEEPFTLELTSSDPLAAIRFTTDGSAPTGPNDGALYREPIEIATTTTVRAASFREGYEPSDVMTHTYVFLSQVAGQSNTQPGYPSSWSGRPA
ncbi:MAG: chitobiase/beta-hexosaminidase C-terminal domain-containing protein, partial [Planctomycetota bacterium]|nr:chitobiase/beta-hexosaminidase C-terminal domain-containing protein [Planctomycetota bacterium]